MRRNFLWTKFKFSCQAACAIIIDSEFLASDPVVRVPFPAPPNFLRSSGSGTGSTQPREYN
jgi:hypothetical protein